VLMIALREGQPHGQGSGRSIPGFRLHEALHQCTSHLVGQGGHASAAGFRILPDAIDMFRESFCGVVARQFGSDSLIVDAVIEVNKRQGKEMLVKIRKLVGDLKDKKIAVLGLAFKPETDDMREAPSVGIIRGLLADGALVQAYDPVAKWEAKKILSEISYADDEYDAVKGAVALIFVTEWNQFRALDMRRIHQLMATPRIADLRNICDPEDMREIGFEYVGVGR